MVPIQKLKRFNLRGQFSHNKTFGAPAVSPLTIGRTAKFIKDQGYTNYCTAAARSVAASYFHDKEMSFEYMTAKEGEEGGTPIYQGADPNIADRACANYGFLPAERSPLTFQQDGWLTPAEWQRYAPELDGEAITYSIGLPYNVYPDFQSIKNALVMGTPENAVVVANGFWYDTWNNAVNGIVPVPATAPITRHSYLFIDFTTINGQEYLVAQLSQGKNYGNGGLLFMSEEVVNTAFKYPAWNGLGCTIFRKAGADRVQTQINVLTRLVLLLGEMRDFLLHA